MDENLGTKRTGIYGPPPKRSMTPWIVLALLAVAVVLFFGLGRRNTERADVNRVPATGMGRRPVDDRTVRPSEAPPRPATDPDLQGAPHDPNEVILPPLPAEPAPAPAPAPAPVER